MPIGGGGGGGGSQPALGASVYLAADVLNYDDSFFLYDTVLFDHGGYWDNVAKHFVVPAGKAGLYLVVHTPWVVADPGETSVQASVFASLPQQIYAPLAAEPGQPWVGSGLALYDAAEGDYFGASVSFDVSTTVTVTGTVNRSRFAIAYLGATA